MTHVSKHRSARAVACEALARQAQRYPDLLSVELETPALDARDAALAHTIYEAAIRRWLTIAYLTETILGRKWAQVIHPLQGAILTGAAQLLFLDRVPAYAAINESVEWAKHSVSPSAAGLVNAALRGLARAIFESDANPNRRFADTYSLALEHLPLQDGRALVVHSSKPLLPPDTIPRLGIASSHPRTLLMTWAKDFGEEAAADLALHSLVDAPVICNTRFAGGGNQVLTPHRVSGSSVFTGPHDQLVPLLAANPRLWVQDPSASEAVDSVADLAPKLVIDLCAGRGTKTRHLACAFPHARILATDTDAARLRSLREVARFFPTVEVLEFTDVTTNFVGQADLVLLDVPCSNTGVLARRPEARYRTATGQLERLVKLQREILTQGVSLLASGGTLLYSTCSIESQENEAQAAWAEQHLPVRMNSRRRTHPAGLPGSPATDYHDGSFSARLVRV
ncbi:MAG TPA: transcription antitermination factor NusB [Phycisphaerales bacterium]|nr:transcription antitermination factor NusB [Phycisphaerales bacterium]